MTLRTRVGLQLNTPYRVDARQLAQATSPLAAAVRRLTSRRRTGRHHATVDLHHRDLLELAVYQDITGAELISQLDRQELLTWWHPAHLSRRATPSRYVS